MNKEAILKKLRKIFEFREGDIVKVDTDIHSDVQALFLSSLDSLEKSVREETVEKAMWCQFCGDELNCFGCEGIPGRTMEENRKLLLFPKKGQND